MPAETFELDAEARHELDEAVAQFEGQRSGRGFAFLDAIYADIDLLVRYPKAGRRLRGGYRSFVVADWSYRIIYTLEGEVLYVWAIAHDARRRSYWRRRVPPSPRSPAKR